MAVDDIYQLAIDQSLNGVLITNVFHYEQTGPGGTDSEQSLIDAWQSDTLPEWELAVATSLLFTCGRARQVSGVGSFPEQFEIFTGENGALVGEALPANAVAVISWYSGTFSKSGRGRSFISGARMVDEDENTWITAQQALWDTFAGAVINTITDAGTGATFKQVIWGGSPATAKTVIKKRGTSASKEITRSYHKGLYCCHYSTLNSLWWIQSILLE